MCSKFHDPIFIHTEYVVRVKVFNKAAESLDRELGEYSQQRPQFVMDADF